LAFEKSRRDLLSVMKYVLMHLSGDCCGDPITQDHSQSVAEITLAVEVSTDLWN